MNSNRLKRGGKASLRGEAGVRREKTHQNTLGGRESLGNPERKGNETSPEPKDARRSVE